MIIKDIGGCLLLVGVVGTFVLAATADGERRAWATVAAAVCGATAVVGGLLFVASNSPPLMAAITAVGN